MVQIEMKWKLKSNKIIKCIKKIYNANLSSHAIIDVITKLLVILFLSLPNPLITVTTAIPRCTYWQSINMLTSFISLPFFRLKQNHIPFDHSRYFPLNEGSNLFHCHVLVRLHYSYGFYFYFIISNEVIFFVNFHYNTKNTIKR